MPGLARREEMAGVHVHRVWMPGKSPAGWIGHTAASLPANARLARGVDILHAHTFASAVPAMYSRRRYALPLVVTLHTSHFLMRAPKPGWRRIFRRIIAAADYLLATSEEIRQVALDIYPHPRSEVMTNAVDTDRFAPGDVRDVGGRRRLIVPRRLFPKNGVEYFVRAMPLIAERADVEARIVGDGPERDRLTALATELGVKERIEFTGARPNHEMPGLLAAAELAVIPSLMEATSIAALEAMSCGTPVAASAVGGLPEIIDDGVGALFQPANPAALAETVLALLQRSDLSNLGAEGRRRVVANWSLDRMVERHLKIYSELLDEATKKEP
ncbi:MAG TPA: glycosyltransferase family 4 protein, partial [Gemmatimonadota bacterium]|nr:glycosyltransferase family 4 protein [Gemmatimonadota bacterium]